MHVCSPEVNVSVCMGRGVHMQACVLTRSQCECMCGEGGAHAGMCANGSSGNYYYTNFTDKVVEAKISSKAYGYVHQHRTPICVMFFPLPPFPSRETSA